MYNTISVLHMPLTSLVRRPYLLFCDIYGNSFNSPLAQPHRVHRRRVGFISTPQATLLGRQKKKGFRRFLLIFLGITQFLDHNPFLSQLRES